MTNLHGDTAQEAASMDASHRATLVAQIAAMDKKCATALDLLERFWCRLFNLGIKAMKDINEHVDYVSVESNEKGRD